MYLFEDQKFFLSVLRQTDFIRPDQALPLLRLFDPRKTQGQTEALIRQLRYAGELAFSGQLLCSPEMLKKQPDPEMLEALDILLALSGRRLLEVSRNPPCKLSFLLQRGEDWIDSYPVYRHIKKDGSLQRIELRDLRDKQIFADLVRQGISPALF